MTASCKEAPVRQAALAMVSGTAWADWWVSAHARTVASLGHYQLAALLNRTPPRAPLSDEEAGFRARRYFPEVGRPQGLAGWAKLMREATATFSVGARATADRACHVLRTGCIPWRQRTRERLFRWRFLRDLTPWLGQFDLIHWQAVDPDRLPAFDCLPAGRRVVLSFLGSDLWRTSGTVEYLLQGRACERADVITVGSAEMANALLAKWGRHLEPKLRFAGYPVTNLEAVLACREQRADFRARLGISPEQVLVCVGNNGTPGNQHLPILRALASIEEPLRRRLVAVIPFTYGGDATYRAALTAEARTQPYETRVLETYQTEAEVGALRASTDVFIHLPITDQLSAAMLEAVCAGAVLVTGSWLPYSRLRTSRIYFHEVAQAADVTACLNHLLVTLPEQRERARGNTERVLAAFHPRVTAGQWDAIYQELLHS